MKRIAIVVFILCLAGLAAASDAADVQHRGRTHTVAWDASLLEDETPCTDCRYEIWIRNVATGTETKIGETSELQLGIVLPSQGRYRVGGLAKRTVEGADEVSEKVWSDNPDVCLDGQTFSFRWVAAPLGPRGLKRQP